MYHDVDDVDESARVCAINVRFELTGCAARTVHTEIKRFRTVLKPSALMRIAAVSTLSTASRILRRLLLRISQCRNLSHVQIGCASSSDAGNAETGTTVAMRLRSE
eukprot:IDg15220t1